jgi:hypothetical protein
MDAHPKIRAVANKYDGCVYDKVNGATIIPPMAIIKG